MSVSMPGPLGHLVRTPTSHLSSLSSYAEVEEGTSRGRTTSIFHRLEFDKINQVLKVLRVGFP